MLSRSIVLSIALLFIASTCYCQKHQVGVHITPSQSFRKLNRESSTSKFDDKIIVVNYGVDYKLELADKVSLYSGLAISTLGYDEATVLKDVKHEHRYHYIDLPVGIEYQLLSTGKFAIAISADIQLNKLFKVTRRTEGNDDLIPDFTIKGSELKDADFQVYNQSFRFSAGVSYQISPKINLGLSPQYQYSLNSTNKNENPNSGIFRKGIHLYSYGVAVSAAYAF